MCEFVQLEKEEVHSHDAYLVAIRQMYAFQRGMAFAESIDRLIGEVVHAHKPYPAELRQLGEFEDGHVRQ